METPVNAQPEKEEVAQEEEQTQEEPYLGPWKTKEEAEKGIANLQSLLDKQGNELGELRRQVEEARRQQQPQQKEEPKVDYDAKIAEVHKKLSALDPLDDDYQKKFADLMAEKDALIEQRAIERSQQHFKQVLDERDIQAMHQRFLEENPDFETPEMQQKIQEYITKDKTGMADALSAYREIQRDQALAEAQRLQAENEELKKLLDLKKGEEATGKVMTRGQPPKEGSSAGGSVRQGMLEAFRSAG